MQKRILLVSVTLLSFSLGLGAAAQIEVPQGHVAFVIASEDDFAPELTDREVAVVDKLEVLGYTDITYISPAKLADADLSKARFVIATEQGTVDNKTVDALIESGKGVVLLYDAAQELWGAWAEAGNSDWRDSGGELYIERDTAFLKGFANTNLSFQIQTMVRYMLQLSIVDNYPPGWIRLGRSTALNADRNPIYKTVFYREPPSGGKGVIFTYDPLGYTEIGDNVFEKILTWVAKPPIVKRVKVPEGNVAFVTPGITDVSMGLTSREVSVQDRLKAMGYQITYVPFQRLKASDLSKAKFIIGVEYPSLDVETTNLLLETGKGVMLLYKAAGSLAGEWGISDSTDSHKLLVNKGEAFLEDYELDTSDVQAQGSARYVTKYPLG